MAQQIKITQTSNADMNIGVTRTQTAVEWLIEQINHQSWNNVIIDIPKDFIEQAKAMEKEQITNAWLNGDADSMYDPKQLQEQAEQYYNETYV